MRVLLLSIILSVSASITCLAESQAEFDAMVADYDAKMKAGEAELPRVVEQYAKSLGCEFNMNPHNIVRFPIENAGKWVALFSLDVGCSMGSAMSRPVIVVLSQSENFHIYINPKYSTPAQTSESLPRQVDSIFVKGSELWYTAREIGRAHV